ncbi:MAG: tannase/feruloyl esterase family alpha/beta hydrolase [Gammaproteobacteria bacterium]
MRLLLIGLALFSPLSPAQTACEEMARALGLEQIPDAPTSLTAAESIEASNELPAHCRIRGYVAPQVRFELRLPLEDWNQKLLMQGCGGLCGDIRSASCDDALARSYAVVTTDMGHQAPAYQSLWALDNRAAEIDFAYRATHVTLVAAKALVARYYGRPQTKAYFRGCSTGGRQGMVSAQRFPADFDGIIAGAPVLDETGTAALHLIWSGLANLDAQDQAVLSADRVAQVHQRIMASCAGDNGLITDPRTCDWRAALVACQDEPSDPACLNNAELSTLNKLYNGARDSKGRSLVPGGLMPGSEYEWVPNFVGADGPAVFHPDGPIQQLYQSLLFYRDPGPGHSAREFDFDRDPPRLALMEVIYSARNPDLRRFRDRGGKLILYQGWDDVEVTPLNTVDYFETLTATMGGAEQTGRFARLFMLPGVAHCRRGPGADTVDWLSYLEAWAETDSPPDEVIAYHLVKEQTYLGLPRPRFPLEPAKFDRRSAIRPYSVVSR